MSKYLLIIRRGGFIIKKSEKTKQKIMESTIEIVGRKGYAATSTREIAESAGISEATIFKYYNSKNQLLESIVSNVIDDFYKYSINEAIPEVLSDSEEKNSQQMLNELITERLSFFNENYQAIQVILQEMMINESIREIFNKKIWTEIKSISNNIFEKGKEENQIRDIDSFHLRKALFGMIFYTFTFEQLLDTENIENYEHQEEAEKIIDILFNGIGRD
mgnify:FL=1